MARRAQESEDQVDRTELGTPMPQYADPLVDGEGRPWPTYKGPKGPDLGWVDEEAFMGD